jgi:hypothetical protein
MEGHCHIADHCYLIDSSLFAEHIPTEISKTQGIPGEIIFLLA